MHLKSLTKNYTGQKISLLRTGDVVQERRAVHKIDKDEAKS